MLMDQNIAEILRDIAAALDRLAPKPASAVSLNAHNAFIWSAEDMNLQPVQHVAHIDLSLLCGLNQAKQLLLDNTTRFAQGFAANNALLWGARGMGKSSLVKAIHAQINQSRPGSLVLVEIHREDLATLPRLLNIIRTSNRNCLLFCDDLSFDQNDASYKSLKTVLEGGIEGRPSNVLFYATSNRRHLMPREMIENENSTAINPAEAVEEKVSLSDRFGLWIGFHQCSQDLYLEMVRGYAKYFHLPIGEDMLDKDALEWAITRGSRSGRVAWQYIQDLAGRLGKVIS